MPKTITDGKITDGNLVRNENPDGTHTYVISLVTAFVDGTGKVIYRRNDGMDLTPYPSITTALDNVFSQALGLVKSAEGV